MVELAVADCADFAASRLELDRPGKSYTVEPCACCTSFILVLNCFSSSARTTSAS